jgi:NADH-quinone oxidoreductase subunit N
MAAAVKAAAFAAFFRVWIEAFGHLYVEWHDALWWLAVVTMFVGNLVALQQRNLKRMLAYSSIGHTGFLLVAITSATAQSPGAMLFYLFAYTLATMGAFAVIISLGTGDNPRCSASRCSVAWASSPSGTYCKRPSMPPHLRSAWRSCWCWRRRSPPGTTCTS